MVDVAKFWPFSRYVTEMLGAKIFRILENGSKVILPEGLIEQASDLSKIIFYARRIKKNYDN